jgi:hypothetical protein
LQIASLIISLHLERFIWPFFRTGLLMTASFLRASQFPVTLTVHFAGAELQIRPSFPSSLDKDGAAFV